MTSTNTYKFLTVLAFIFLPVMVTAKVYFVDNQLGSDENKGLTRQSPIKSLKKVSQLHLEPGDQVLFAKGQVFKGTLDWENVSGTSEKKITVGSYSSKAETSDVLPVIDAQGFRNGILLTNCSNIKILDLMITANGGGVPHGENRKSDMRCGVLVNTTRAGIFENIVLSNLTVKDIFFADKGVVRSAEETRTANGTQSYGWGIRFINRTKDAIIKNIKVEECEVRNVGHTGIKLNGRNHSIQNPKIFDNRVVHSGGPGIQMSGILDGHIKGNYVTHSGSTSDSRKWGRGSGLWTWGCSRVLIEHNSFRNANGPADSAGCHIDFNCDNVIVQYNLSENNAGGFCEILGNNYHCAYRYNVSINDGHRVKRKGVAFQEGKIFWLSGFNGKGRDRKGPFNSYFYNNTIYVKSDIEAKVAVDRAAEGVLIANNIFYLEGKSKWVLGDQYKPETDGESLVKNIVFKNNLFLNASNWPEAALIQDEAPIYGDPGFLNKKGIEIEDFIPENKELVKNRGINIQALPGDKNGLYIGLDADHDILGNQIRGLPDMGAVELQ